MRELLNRVAVVTGAASGIGLAMAEKFAAEGMNVVLADMDEDSLNSAVDRVGEHRHRALSVPTDVSQPQQVQALADAAFTEFGAVHLLCNNAGVASVGLSWQQPLVEWRRMFDVNLWGVVNGLHAFLPRMLRQPEGHVVNTASIAGLLAAPCLGAYMATKHAVVGLSECLYHDLALMESSVQVSVLCPCWVRTDIYPDPHGLPAEAEVGAAVGDPATAEIVTQAAASFAQSIAQGVPPETVASAVVDAVRSSQFWILTHPEFNSFVTERFARAVAGQQPIPPQVA